jgi:hypothetical protein
MKLFGCYYLVSSFDFFINRVPESPRVGLPKTSKQSLPALTPSISGKTRGDGEKWLWYLDSASLNYPGTDTLVPAIELAEICVIFDSRNIDATYFFKIKCNLNTYVYLKMVKTFDLLHVCLTHDKLITTVKVLK